MVLVRKEMVWRQVVAGKGKPEDCGVAKGEGGVGVIPS